MAFPEAYSPDPARYDGSMPMCGVVGDTTLFDTFAAMQAAAHVLGGSHTVPLDQWSAIKTQVTGTLFTNFGAAAGTPLTPNGTAGQAYASVLQNLTGGRRPMFDTGSAKLQREMSIILRQLGPVLNRMPNSLSITGHTDARQYATGEREYSNWELSIS